MFSDFQININKKNYSLTAGYKKLTDRPLRLADFLEGDFEQVGQSVVFGRIGVGVHAVDHLAAVQGLKSAENTVPNREDIPVIGIGVGQAVVVVHLVHIGRDQNPTQGFVQFSRQCDIGVVELRKNHR